MKKPIVIIGAGITGLSTGIALAKNIDINEQPILIFEKNRIAGGCVASFKRNGFLFDTTQVIPDIRDVLDYFQVDIDLIKFKENYAKIFLKHDNNSITEYLIPSGMDNFKEYLCKTFPEDADSIRYFIKYSNEMYNELFELKIEPNIFQTISILFKCPKIIANSNKTFSQYLERFKFKSASLIEYLNQFAAFSSLPSERCAALLTIGSIFTSLTGAYRTQKGFYEFPQKLAKRFIELGGNIYYRTEVTEIIMENNSVTSIKTSKGDIIETGKVITTIDPKIAMKNLVGIDVLNDIDKKYADKVQKVKMSPSSIHISLGLDDRIDLTKYNLSAGYNILSTNNNTFAKLFELFDKNQISYNENLFRCGIVCPTLTIGGNNVLSVRIVPVCADNWDELRNKNHEEYSRRKSVIADFFIKQIENNLIPELSKHIVYTDIATPSTFKRYNGSATGSNYDMSPYVDNFGRKRLKMRTPVRGLFQPKFSHGIWSCMQAGIQVADMILNGKIMKGSSRFSKSFIQ